MKSPATFPRRALSRRALLRGAGMAGGALALAACSAPAMPGMHGGGHTTPVLNSGRAPSAGFKPDLDLTLTATPAEVALLPGKPTRVWRYEARVNSGDAAQVEANAAGYLGPVLRVRTGQKLRVTFNNALPEGNPSNIHWHGLRPPPEMDGHPADVVAPGASYAYEFEVTDPAMTAWFHPHPHGLTGRQVTMGLAGMVLVSDEAEQKLGLPSGAQDVPLVIQDRSFDSDNQIVYFGRGMMSGMMDQMMGFYGERILVNGRVNAALDLPAQPHRLRLLNGSTARIYKLKWSDNTPLTVIGTDNGLLDVPARRGYVMLAPGERIELWVDLSARKPGETIRLITDHFEAAENVPVPARFKPEMKGVEQMMMPHTGPNELGSVADVLTVRVTQPTAPRVGLPPALRPSRLASLPIARRREFKVTHKRMRWMFNGRTWDDPLTDEERVRQGDTEVWTFENGLNLGEMMDPMGMAHPIHLHGVHFHIIERKQTIPELLPLGYDEVNQGWLDLGTKDTFLLMPGERVSIQVTFAQQRGRYLYHCHNLEHEDQGLMRNYEVI